MKIIIDIPEEEYNYILKSDNSVFADCASKECMMHVIKNGTPFSKTIDSLKELSKEHRHNYISNSHEERAWRLGIEDSIDLILAESEEDSVIITKFSKDDIVEMSGVMRVMNTEMNNIKSVDGLVEKINQIELLADKTRGDIKDEAIKIIKEYCEV